MFGLRFFKIFPVVAGWVMVAAVSHGIGAEAGVPISIVSKRMVAKNVDRLILFEGNVVLTKGDFTLTADRLEVTLPPSPPDQPSGQGGGGLLAAIPGREDSVDRIEAYGRVEVRQGERHGRADHAVYDQKEEKVTLTGTPEVWDKEYRVSGKKMIFFLRENRSVVEDSKAILYPRQTP